MGAEPSSEHTLRRVRTPAIAHQVNHKAVHSRAVRPLTKRTVRASALR